MKPRIAKPTRNNPLPRGLFFLVGFPVLLLGACGGAGEESGRGVEEAVQEVAPITLGPRDGRDLPPTDLERVTVGSVAPDFSLQTLQGDTLTLSQFRGSKDVVLVFYRGYW